MESETQLKNILDKEPKKNESILDDLSSIKPNPFVFLIEIFIFSLIVLIPEKYVLTPSLAIARTIIIFTIYMLIKQQLQIYTINKKIQLIIKTIEKDK